MSKIEEFKHKIALDSARIYAEKCVDLLTMETGMGRDKTKMKLYNNFILNVYLNAYKSNLESLEKEDQYIQFSSEVVKTFKQIEKLIEKEGKK